MSSAKDLILASKQFTGENRLRSWLEIWSSVLLAAAFLTATILVNFWPVQLASGIACGLMYVRLFVIYHDYQHRAILQKLYNCFMAHEIHWCLLTGTGDNLETLA